jgi:tagaturonate epimerase
VVGLAQDAATPKLVSVSGRSLLAVPPQAEGFAGEVAELDGQAVRLVEKTHASAAAVRTLMPSLTPEPLGTAPSFGFGDRIGLATPGHVRALQSARSTLRPVLAQQSARELARTGRSFEDVLDAATWGALEAGWTAGYGADADHLGTADEVENARLAGFTMLTLDPSAHVDEPARAAGGNDLEAKIAALPWDILEDNWAGLRARHATAASDEVIARTTALFGRALAHLVELARPVDPGATDIEVSIDETAVPTTTFEHLFLAVELRRLGVGLTSLAPRFPGRWEKALDAAGDFDEIARAIRAHSEIAAEHGPYKLSVHSGSDKFAVYEIVARETGGLVHVKTSGTSYLEALRVVARVEPALFREILAVSHERFELDRASYELSPGAHVPSGDRELLPLLDDAGARQGLHVTYGAVLSNPQIAAALTRALEGAAEAYAQTLEHHLGRHLALLR